MWRKKGGGGGRSERGRLQLSAIFAKHRVVYIAELQTALIFKNLNHFLQNVLNLLAFYVHVVFTNNLLPANAAKSCIIQIV